MTDKSMENKPVTGGTGPQPAAGSPDPSGIVNPGVAGTVAPQAQSSAAPEPPPVHKAVVPETAPVKNPEPANSNIPAVDRVIPGAIYTGPNDKKKNSTLMIIAFILGIIIIVLLFMLALVSIVNRGNPATTPTPSPSGSVTETVVPTGKTTTAPTQGAEKLTITKPTADKIVDGKFLVEGIATVSLNKLTIKAYDNNDVELGTGEVTLTGNDPQGTLSYSLNLQLTKGPETDAGYIKVFPKNAGVTSPLTQTVDVTFETSLSARVKVFSPLKNMKYTGAALLFKGEMKDFFEGTMSVRLKGENGGVLFDSSINSNGDNYGQFAPFEKMVNAGPVPSTAGSTGKWEFYDVAMGDGSVTVLLTIPVTF